jgi:sigma-B regulation protein RsbU (phosphoserine phosphatase)
VIADAREDLPAALDRFEARGRGAGLAEPEVRELRLVAEEVLTNVAKYAFAPGRTAGVEWLFSFTPDATVLEFRDQGIPFDPLGQAPPDLDAPLAERPLGGLGLTLVRAFVDEAGYVRDGSTNVLRLVKRRTAR